MAACQEFAVAEALRSLTAEKLKEALQADSPLSSMNDWAH